MEAQAQGTEWKVLWKNALQPPLLTPGVKHLAVHTERCNTEVLNLQRLRARPFVETKLHLKLPVCRYGCSKSLLQLNYASPSARGAPEAVE